MNYCKKCGAEISSDAKFCSNCGSALYGADSPKFDAHIRVSMYNEITEKGLEGVGRGLSFVLMPMKIGWLILKRYKKLIVTALGALILLFIVAVIGAWLLDKHEESQIAQALQDLEIRIKTAQGETVDYGWWSVLGSYDPANKKKIGRVASVRSEDGLCVFLDLLQPDGFGGYGINCSFAFASEEYGGSIIIKFDNEDKTHEISLSHYQIDIGNVSDVYLLDLSRRRYRRDYGLGKEDPSEYDNFTGPLLSGSVLAINVIPRLHPKYYESKNFITQRHIEKLDPVWIRFSLRGAKEAIAKLGQELNE